MDGPPPSLMAKTMNRSFSWTCLFKATAVGVTTLKQYWQECFHLLTHVLQNAVCAGPLCSIYKCCV